MFKNCITIGSKLLTSKKINKKKVKKYSKFQKFLGNDRENSNQQFMH